MNLRALKTMLLAAILSCGLSLKAAETTATASGKLVSPPVQPEAMKRWQDQRFGMFIHWGPVSLTAQEIGWSRGRNTPIEEYDSLYQRFNPTDFNADEWVGVAKAGGMKYIVLTTKHHDGFCLWDTKLTDYNIMKSPFGRDVVRELAEACRAQGLGFGAYYSTCDWHHPDFPLTSPGGKVKRDRHDLDAYNRYLLGQVEELITGYGPLFTLWCDVPQMFKGRGVATIKLARGLQPDIVINNRTGDGGDYDTPEQKVGRFSADRPWESCMTISAHNHWAWGGPEDGVKPLAACLEMLVRCAGGNGNMLLNVGPRPDGIIDPEQASRLREIGDWLAIHGEAIYGTRGGPWTPTPSLASTRRDNIIYLHLVGGVEESVVLPALPRRILSGRLLTGGEVGLSQTTDSLVVTVAARDRQPVVTTVRLDLDGPAMDIEPIAMPGIRAGWQARASNVFQKSPSYGPEFAIDDDPRTRWATDSGTSEAWLEIDLGAPTTISQVMIDEWVGRGKRIKSFELRRQQGDEWITFHRGGEIGARWKTAFEPVKSRRFRLHVLAASEGPSINEISLLK